MDLPNNFNNSYITDVDIDTDNKFRKNTIISDSTFDSRFNTPFSTPCNGDILWTSYIHTPYTNIDSHNTNLNHDSLFNIFNCFSICNWPDYNCPDCNCPDCNCPS